MRIIIIILLITFPLIACTVPEKDKTYDELETAIESGWKQDIDILLDDTTNDIVIFTDNKRNFTLNTYNQNDEGFQYHSDGEKGWQFESNIATLEFVWNTNHMHERNNQIILWGADFQHHQIDLIKFHFTNKENIEKQYTIEVPVINNAFVKPLPLDYKEKDYNKVNIVFYFNGNQIEEIELGGSS